MDEQDKRTRIVRVKQLLAEIHNVPIATVNKNGSPHLSPVFMAFNDKLNGFWSSSPESLHSLNIARSGEAFIVIFDSREGHGGLFMSGKATMLQLDKDIEKAYMLLKFFKMKTGGDPKSLGKLGESRGQKIYKFEPAKFWINYSLKDTSGEILNDQKYEIKFTDIKN